MKSLIKISVLFALLSCGIGFAASDVTIQQDAQCPTVSDTAEDVLISMKSVGILGHAIVHTAIKKYDLTVMDLKEKWPASGSNSFPNQVTISFTDERPISPKVYSNLLTEAPVLANHILTKEHYCGYKWQFVNNGFVLWFPDNIQSVKYTVTFANNQIQLALSK